MQPATSDISKNGKKLLVTLTGELLQPVRVYYRIQDEKSIKRAFSKLKCVSFDPDRSRYVWLYQKEAKNLVFKNPYSSIPSEQRPIVIGSFFLKKPNEMYLEIRSIERAIEGIVFFDKYIKTYMAKVEDICIINKMFSSDEITMDFSGYFDKEITIDPEETLKQLQASVVPGKALDSIFNEMGNESLPEVERFPSHFYEDGIALLKSTLQSRQYVAIQHWRGNKDYTLGDFVSKKYE